MTVGSLKKLLASLPDDAFVLVPASDHSYRNPSAGVGTALRDKYGIWTEDHGEQRTPEREYGKRLAVLVIE